MVIKKLSLKNFRNYDGREFDFSPKTTLIAGPNTVGKTNILEAIYLLATGKSLRATYDKDLIQFDSPLSHLSCLLIHNENQTTLELAITSDEKYANLSRKRFKINGVSRSMNKFVGNLNTVMFSPEDIELVTDSPSLRRRYLDSVLIQVDRNYQKAITDYGKVLRRRNKLLEQLREKKPSRSRHSELDSESKSPGLPSEAKMLKRVQHDSLGLNFWDEKLIEAGMLVQGARTKFFEYLDKVLANISKSLLIDDQLLKMEYSPNLISERRLEKYRDREIAAAKTLVGPHRDDFRFYMEAPQGGAATRDLSSFGSRGEQRTAVLALKMAELDFIRKRVGESPVLLLDDIFSELDETHRQRVLELLGKQQTILTTTDEGLVGDMIKDVKVIRL